MVGLEFKFLWVSERLNRLPPACAVRLHPLQHPHGNWHLDYLHLNMADREELIRNAVSFLADPKVRLFLMIYKLF